MSQINISIFPGNEIENDIPRFSVARAMLPSVKDGIVYLVLENEIPCTIINDYVLRQQVRNYKSHTNEAYTIAKTLNALLGKGKDMKDITISDIYIYFSHLHSSRQANVLTIYNQISIIENLFEHLALQNYPIHKSLYKNSALTYSSSKEKRNITRISQMKKVIIASIEEKEKYNYSSYTKWYTDEQVAALYEELKSQSLGYAGIFAVTIMLGYRFDSAASILLKDTNLPKGTIQPSRTKTNRNHISAIPDHLDVILTAYIENERSLIVSRTGSTEPYLFLNKFGNQISYHAYSAALKKAAKNAMIKNPALNLEIVHTHAGRSTFAANLRTAQLEALRRGEPTFSDADICTLMDWKNIATLNYYDKSTRAQEIAPMTARMLNDLNKALAKRSCSNDSEDVIGLITFARTDSICLLTKDALIKKPDGEYEIHILNFKTAAVNVQKGHPNYTIHKLPHELGVQIEEYIKKTDHLRAKMDKPYIFVYMSTTWRENTKRLPQVLTTNTFNDALSSVYHDNPAYDKHGNMVGYTLKQVRAKGGGDLFATGYSSSAVANKLGNTPKIAEQHYSTISVKAEAASYNKHYSIALSHISGASTTHSDANRDVKEPSVPVMYGTCTANIICGLSADCSICQHRTICKPSI